MSTELIQFDALKAELTSLVAPTLTIKVVDFPSSASAIEAAKAVKTLLKKVEETRKGLVGPLNDRVKEINDYAKSITAPLGDAETHLKRQLASFEMEQEKIRQEEYRRAEDEHRKREAEILAKQEAERKQLAAVVAHESEASDIFGADAEEPTVDTKAAELEQRQLEERARATQEAKDREYNIKSMGVANARKTWKCEIENIELVPKEFLVITLNNAAVLAAARAGVTKIAGVKLWQETTIAIGANTSVARALR